MKTLHLMIFVIAVLFLTGCESDDDGENPQVATVTIAYNALTTIDPRVAAEHPGCVSAVARTHIHPSWRNFANFPLVVAAAQRWEITFNDVPVERDVSFRINDPNGCDTDPNGAVTVDIFANGVRLTRVVSTPGNGQEPGLAFRVNRNGTVTP